MIDELLPVDFETKEEGSIIKVIGVGGGGGNAVNHMLFEGITGVDFVICNTDAQALENSKVPVKIQLGQSLTEGRGAGNKPEKGRESAIESLEEIKEVLNESTKMVFVTAGMGGGTGTGAAPIIAEAAKELNILTVGIVTIPFRFEGKTRISQALEGISNLEQHVDALLVINNEKLRTMYGDLKLSEAFMKADDVLSIAAKSIAEIITVHGYINVDFADVETVMRDSGVAVMGSAKASGEDRAIRAIEQALSSPLLNSNNISGARNILLNIISGVEEVSMSEISEITDYVNDIVGDDVSIIWGNGNSDKLGNELSVTIIATGFSENPIPQVNLLPRDPSKSKKPTLQLVVEDPAAEELKAAQRIKEKNRRELLMRQRSKELEEEKKQKADLSKKNKEPNQQENHEDEKQESSNVDNWFKERFTKLFDNKDTPM
jgi:cell division protein FtsZ